MPKLLLVSVDLPKARQHYHPDIKLDGTHYLAKLGNGYQAGTFCKVWFGLHFEVFWCTGRQFDAPGYNGSDWEGLWEI